MPTAAPTPQRHPCLMPEHGSTGGILRAFYNPGGDPADTSDTLHGRIWATYTDGGGNVSDPFYFQQYVSSALAPIIVHDDVFALSHAHEAQSRFNGSWLIKGEGKISYWYSADDGRTWTRVAGTGGGSETQMQGIDDGTF